jgi:hypothetical protein
MTFLDENGETVDEVETPPFLLNCNRTQQRYTNALMLADRFLDEGRPVDQTYFLREGEQRQPGAEATRKKGWGSQSSGTLRDAPR